MKEYIVDNNDKGRRLDKYLLKILNEATSSFVYKMLRKKNIVLNDKKASGNEILNKGDNIKIYLSDETFNKFHKDASSNIYMTAFKSLKGIRVIDESPDYVIYYKPSGILSQRDSGNILSLNEYHVGYLLDKKIITEDSLNKFKPSVCNRLDRNTDGLVICANNYESARILTGIIKDRTVKKYYKCTVEGKCELEGTFKAYLIKDNKTNKVTVSDKPFDNSKEIITAFKPLEYKDNNTLMEVDLITGKSHQIRAHLSHLGFPIVGDGKYGTKGLNNGQWLTCYKLVFDNNCQIKGLSGRTITL